MRRAISRKSISPGRAWLGKDRDTLTGYPFADYVVKDDIPIFLDHVRKCVEQRCEVTSELRLLADGGLSRTVQFRSIPVGRRAARPRALQDRHLRHHRNQTE